MKRKLAYALIMAILVMTLLPPSAAAEISSKADTLMKDRLGNVTAKVKQTLEIGDHYTNFNGTLQEDILKSYWNLNWSSDHENLTIQALESGKIMQYSRYKTQDGIYKPYNPIFEPAFPVNSKAAALEVAKNFLNQVLTLGETADFGKINAQESLSATQYYFSGSILLNGLESGLSFNINVNADDLMVQSFSRSDSYSKIIGEIPSKETGISQEAAAWLLKGKIGLKLEYVLIENDLPPVTPFPRPMPTDLVKAEIAPDAVNNILPTPVPIPAPQPDPQPTEPKTYTAVLRYLPFIEGNWMVDAKTGELIDVSRMFDNLKGRDEMSSVAPSPSAIIGKGGYEEQLTPTEMEGVEKLKDALSKEVLTEMLFQIKALKMDRSYQLSGYNFYLNESNGDITAFLNFNKPLASNTKLFSYKNATMNAKTGELISFSSSYPYLEETLYDITVNKESAEATTRLFLEEYATDHFAASALYNSSAPEKPEHFANSFQFTYAHSVNGYFLASNNISVGVNAQTGAIDSFYQSWTDGVVFDSAEGILAETAAIDIYANAHETKLQYLQLPAAIDPSSPLYEPLKAYGYGYIYEYRLAYQYAYDSYIYGIDAKTGQVLENTYNNTLVLPEYNDIGGHYAENQIKTLAQYGIGFNGDSFLPNQDLTQREMLIFILSANNSRTELENNEDYLYNQAYSLNMLTKEERNPSAIVDRCDLVKAILNMSGYGKVAKIPGIFVVKFADQATIAAEDYGYVAIAQGLKLVNGDLLGNFTPQQNATRAMAAMVYYNFLNR